MQQIERRGKRKAGVIATVVAIAAAAVLVPLFVLLPAPGVSVSISGVSGIQLGAPQFSPGDQFVVEVTGLQPSQQVYAFFTSADGPIPITPGSDNAQPHLADQSGTARWTWTVSGAAETGFYTLRVVDADGEMMGTATLNVG